MLNVSRQVLAFIAVTGAVIAVVEACSRTAIPIFDNPGGAALVYGLSMVLVWLTRHVVPFALPPGYYRLRPVENDGGLYRRLGVVAFKWLLFKSRIELLNGSARLSHWLLLANVVANVYPIMLQRHHRARLLPVLAKLRSGCAVTQP